MNDHESGNPLEKRPAASWGSALTFLVSLALALGLPSPALAGPNDEDVQTAWRLLDYVAVDYRGAVADGRVINTQESAEMTEFSNAVEAKIGGLPSSPNRASLNAEAKAFRAMVAGKAAPDDVSTAARTLGSHLLAAHPVPLGPSKAPDLARGAALYAQNCASCHGLNGDTARSTQGRPRATAPPLSFRLCGTAQPGKRSQQ